MLLYIFLSLSFKGMRDDLTFLLDESMSSINICAFKILTGKSTAASYFTIGSITLVHDSVAALSLLHQFNV